MSENIQFELSNNHWRVETFTERVTTKQWQQILLKGKDAVIFHGTVRQLKARYLGAGVYEIYKVSE